MAGTLVANTINTDTGLFSTNNAYLGIAKAWVFWNTNSGTPIINSSFNVSSVTYSGVGLFVINFGTAFADVNYVMGGSVGANPSGTGGFIGFRDNSYAPTASSAGIYTVNGANALANYTINNAVFFHS